MGGGQISVGDIRGKNRWGNRGENWGGGNRGGKIGENIRGGGILVGSFNGKIRREYHWETSRWGGWDSSGRNMKDPDYRNRTSGGRSVIRYA